MPGEFDEAALMDSLDGDLEFLEETIEILEEDCPPLLEEIRGAAAARDAAALVTPAHTLKGMFANFCAGPAGAIAKNLESAGRAGELGDVEAEVQTLEHETERLRQALQSFLQAQKQ